MGFRDDEDPPADDQQIAAAEGPKREAERQAADKKDHERRIDQGDDELGRDDPGSGDRVREQKTEGARISLPGDLVSGHDGQDDRDMHPEGAHEEKAEKPAVQDVPADHEVVLQQGKQMAFKGVLARPVSGPPPPEGR